MGWKRKADEHGNRSAEVARECDGENEAHGKL